MVGLIDWDKCATVPLAGYDPVAFAREDDEEMCLALFSAEEREDGGDGEVGRWYRSRVGKLARALESSGQSYRVWVAKEIFEELCDGSVGRPVMCLSGTLCERPWNLQLLLESRKLYLIRYKMNSRLIPSETRQ